MRHIPATVCLMMLASGASAWADVRLLPAEFTLQGSEGRQQLSVVALRDESVSAALPWDEVTLQSDDPEVVCVEGGVAVAVADGTTTITARTSSGESATATVRVVATGQPHRWNFRNDVESVFARIGCNMGACHGALAGKGGFRLSLRGYDPVADHFSITGAVHGRRIEIANPATSLILTKPTGAVPHRGGLKLDVQSRNYRILAEWIAAGAPGPRPEDPQLESISVSPPSAFLLPGDQSRILVSGHYDDGRVVDVTHWARFTVTDEAVASVTEDGTVTVRGSGEGAVLVWFGSKVALARMTVPYQHPVAAEVYAAAPRRNFIDDLNLRQLETLQLAPSPRCDDATFLRRATLTTLGRLPTTPERETYFGDTPAERRDLLIERLLQTDDFADYWAYRWSDILLVNGTRLRPVAVKTYYQWIHAAVRDNMPWDQFVREILTAVGRSDENGATNFFALNQSPEDMTENACQAFLGLSIGCAKCHNHPLEKWTNDQYYSMANLFARVRAKGWGGDGREGDGLRTLYVATSGELIQPRRGKPQPPAPLDAEPLAFDDQRDRREALADWITDPENPYFARAIANRIWANFFGRGLVEQVDDLRLSNPASNEPLLEAAARYLVQSAFDLKQLMRALLQSETFQRASTPLPTNSDEQKYFSRYYPRRMMAEVLLDSIDQVLGTSTAFDKIAFPGADTEKTEFYPLGTRAIQLYDSAVDSYFLKTFGRNPREITCECQRSEEPSVVQVLHLCNGDTLNEKIGDGGNVVAGMIAAGKSDAEIVEALFLAALTRRPSSTESECILKVVAEYGDDRKTALQDAAWGILTSGEFTFVH